MRVRRPPCIHFSTVDLAIESAFCQKGLVLIDLDGTLVSPGTDVEEARFREHRFRATEPAGRAQGLIVTNRRHGPREVMKWPVVVRARKPFTSRAILRTWSHHPVICVIGDQYATDGLLAARLGVPFFRVIPLGKRPTRASLGDALLSVLFLHLEGRSAP
jgi:predicted HAD superfamily phosphohydrolase YqeG